MISTNKLEKESHSAFHLMLLAALEFFIAGIVTLLISPDPKNAFFFGFSPLRVVLVAGIWAIAVALLLAGLTIRKRQIGLDSLWLVHQGKILRYIIYSLSFLLISWGWVALFSSPTLFSRRIYIFERIQPLSVAVGIVLMQGWLLYLYFRGRLNFRIELKSIRQNYLRLTLFFTAMLIAVEIIILATKFGLLSNINNILANEPGIPIAGLQWFLIVLVGALWIGLIQPLETEGRAFKFVDRYRLIPLLLFIAAVLTWGLTPMVRHFFSLEPQPPAFQPFPISDARIYDLGGISILRGYGVFFHIQVDKPLYMIFLAILHFFAGQNYHLMIWFQIILLAFIPVTAYDLGKRFQSRALGVCLALVMIIRQRNAIVLSDKIPSTNPQLLMSEELMLLAMLLLALMAFRWMQERKLWQAIVCGMIVGAGSLIRLNPLFTFPALLVLFFLALRKQGKKILLAHLLTYSLAFLIVLAPWLIAGMDTHGNPWLLSRIHQVIEQRYGNTTPSIPQEFNPTLPTSTPLATSSGNVVPVVSDQSSVQSMGLIKRVFFHLLHNYSTSLMALPNSLVYVDLNHLAQRPYWQDENRWQGDLPPSQIIFILINIALLGLGLAYSWKKFSWAGLVLLSIYLSYLISLGLAMTSGGRYLVPIDWIFYFYYFMAIIGLLQFVLGHVLKTELTPQALQGKNGIIPATSDRRALALSLSLALILSILFPIANSAIKTSASLRSQQADMAAAAAELSKVEAPGTTLIYGEVFYPYYYQGTLSFDLVTPLGANSFSVNDPGDLADKLQGGEFALVAARYNEQGLPQVETFYLARAHKPELVWKRQP